MLYPILSTVALAHCEWRASVGRDPGTASLHGWARCEQASGASTSEATAPPSPRDCALGCCSCAPLASPRPSSRRSGCGWASCTWPCASSVGSHPSPSAMPRVRRALRLHVLSVRDAGRAVRVAGPPRLRRVARAAGQLRRKHLAADAPCTNLLGTFLHRHLRRRRLAADAARREPLGAAACRLVGQETLPRHSLDTPWTLPRHVLDTS